MTVEISMVAGKVLMLILSFFIDFIDQEIIMACTSKHISKMEIYYLLFGVLHCFQHCTGHITMDSFVGRGNQYIQLVKVLYCKLPINSSYLGFYIAFNTVQVISPRANNYQISHLRSGWEPNPNLRGGRRECNHSATMTPETY